MADTAAIPPETSRRRLLAWLGAGGAAALATLFSRDEARAGHDGTNVLHLGEVNETPAGASTMVGATAEIFAFRVHNEHTAEGSGGILASSRGDQPGITGQGFDASPEGVRGISLTSTEELGPNTGVLGLSGSGVGVVGDAPSGTGVVGHSETGTGGSFQSDAGTALQAIGPAAVGANVDNFALGVDNEHTGGTAGGILAVSRGGKPAVEGDAIPSEHHPGVGVQGVSGFDETFGQGPGIGVQGISGTGIGVEGSAGLEEPEGVGVSGHGGHAGVVGNSVHGEAGAKGVGGQVDDAGVPFGSAAGVVGKSFASVGVHGETESPTAPAVLGESWNMVERGNGRELSSAPGVVGRSGSGVGVRGESLTGFGLEVLGKAGFSTVGSAAVPAGQSSEFVANAAVTADSHIAVTLASDPGRRAVRWVERAPGSGFTVHLTAPAQGNLELTYSIVEPI